MCIMGKNHERLPVASDNIKMPYNNTAKCENYFFINKT